MNKKSLIFELSSIANRLAQIKEILRITSKQLAESAGVSEQTFSAWFKGKNPPTAEALVAWMIEYNLNINWFLIGEGDPFGDDAPAPIASALQAQANQDIDKRPTIRRTGEHSPVEYVAGPHIVEVPVHGVAEAGRMGLEIFELAPSRFIPVLQRYYRENLIAFEVDGRSMEPTIRKGAVIGVIPVDGDLIDGEMYLVKRPHFGLLVKRVHMGKDALILKSDNDDFVPLELPYEGYEADTVILGRVIWIWQDV